MKAFWAFGAASLSNSSTVYIPIPADVATIPNSFTEGGVALALSEDVTITRIVVTSSAPGAGKSRTFTFRVDGVDTAASAVMSGTGTSAEWTGSVSVAALSLVCIAATPSGTPSAGTARILIEYTTAGDFYLMPTIMTGTNSTNTSTTYLNPDSVGSGGYSTTASDREFVCPTGLTITKLTTRLSAAPGASKSWAVSARKNNSTDSLTATVTGASTTVATATGSTSVAAGDRIALKMVPSGTPAAAAIQTCLTIAPDNAGEIAFGACVPNMNTTTTAAYALFTGSGNSSWLTTESSRQLPIPAGTLSKLYVKTSSAPASGKSFTFTLRNNASNTALVAAVANTATTGNDSVHTATTTDGDLIDMQSVAAGTPASSNVGRFSAVFVYPPAAPANTGQFFAMF